MRRVVVRYRVKPERADENVELVQRVFAELERERPDGIRYMTLRLGGGVDFMHVAFVAAEQNPLLALAAFRRFTEAIADRCSEPPVTMTADIVGEYRLLAT